MCAFDPSSVVEVGGLDPFAARSLLGQAARADDSVSHGPPLARWAKDATLLGVEAPAVKLVRVEKEL